MTTSFAGDWPLTGRSEELELVRSLVTGDPRTSAVIGGDAGVGKSRLARAVLADAAAAGWATLEVRGSEGYGSVPLGPWRTVLHTPGAHDLAELSAFVTAALDELRTGRGLAVLVDDCHALDDASAGLLHQLVSAKAIVALVTVRSGTKVPASITSLWKDGLATRVELQNLSQQETSDLLAAGLSGSVGDSTAARLWHVTGGNPLYLREVVLSGIENGALSRGTAGGVGQAAGGGQAGGGADRPAADQAGGEWSWRGAWATGSRLREIVEARLERLASDELSAIETLAVGGSLPLDVVAGLASNAALQSLEERDLIRIETSGRRTDVSIAHPLHAEVLRSTTATLRQRSIRRHLVDALTATRARRTSDRVRIACWSIDTGVDVDPMTLTLGSRASLYGIASAIAERLREVLPEAAAGIPDDAHSVRQDFDVALRLARTAYENDGSVANGVALASAYGWTGATDEADAVLAEVASRADDADDRVRLSLARSWLSFWGKGDVEAARAVVLESLEQDGAACAGQLRAEAYQDLAGLSLNTAWPEAALGYCRQSAEAQGVPLALSVAAPAAVAASSYIGRSAEAVALTDDGLPSAYEAGHPLTISMLLFGRAGALARLGQLRDARNLLEWMRNIALTQDLVGATAVFGVLLGEVLLRQGLPHSAGRIFRDSSGLLADHDVFGYRPWALTGLARARAAVGDERSARAAFEEAISSQTMERHYDYGRYQAESDILLLAGDREGAIRAARTGAAWAREHGLLGDEAFLLDASARIAPNAGDAERLAEIAAAGDSELVAVLARHAQALVGSDATALLEIAEDLGTMEAWWLGAESAARASQLLASNGERTAAAAAGRAALRLVARCEIGLRTPIDAARNQAGLTAREREVATLAAQRHSNKEIAARMRLSTRTVENHLYRAYMKLGVTDRIGLAEALAGAE